MNKSKLFIAAFCLTSSSAAMAENWTLFEATRAGSKYYYDKDSFSEDEDNYVLKVWVKIDSSNDKTVKAREIKDLFVVNCKDKEIYESMIIEYNAYGNVIRQYGNGSMYSGTPIVPGSIGSSLYNKVCMYWEIWGRK